VYQSEFVFELFPWKEKIGYVWCSGNWKATAEIRGGFSIWYMYSLYHFRVHV